MVVFVVVVVVMVVVVCCASSEVPSLYCCYLVYVSYRTTIGPHVP